MITLPPPVQEPSSLARTAFAHRHARPRDQHVDRRHDEQREHRADDHAADQHDADAVARAGAGTGREHQRKVTDDGRRRRHQDRTQPRAGGFDHRVELLRSRLLQVVRELHDQDAVLRDQADQRDQPDLAVDVQRREAEEREQQRAGHRQRHRPGEDDERIAEALELRREHQIDQDRRQQERAEELAAFGPELARFARVVDREALRQDLPRLVFEKAAAPDRAAPAAESRPGCARRSAAGTSSARAARSSSSGWRTSTAGRAGRRGAGDVDLLELIGRQPLGAHHLRNDLVAASLDAEPVDVVGAEQRRQIAAGLAQIDALRAQLVAIEDDLRLRLIELQIGVGEDEQAARERLLAPAAPPARSAASARPPTRSPDRPESCRRRAAAAAPAE